MTTQTLTSPAQSPGADGNRRDWKVIALIGILHGSSHFYQLVLPSLYLSLNLATVLLNWVFLRLSSLSSQESGRLPPDLSLIIWARVRYCASVWAALSSRPC